MQADQKAAVKAGIFVLVGLVVMIVIIMILGQRSQLFQRHYDLRTSFHNAGGLIPGATVRLAGVNVGTVSSVKLVSGRGTPGLVEVHLDIVSDHQEKIRRDSYASIRTLGVLGDKYVEITLGSFGADVLKPGEYIAPQEAVDFYEIADEAKQALQRANTIAKSVADTLEEVDKAAIVSDLSESVKALRRMLEAAEEGGGLLHALLHDEELPKMLNDLKATAKALRTSVETINAGKGGLGELIHGERLVRAIDDLAEASAAAKSLLKELKDGKGIGHALIYEEAGKESLKRLDEAAVRLNEVIAQYQESEGTLKLLISDPTVWESVKRVLGGAEESKVLQLLIRKTPFPEAEPELTEDTGEEAPERQITTDE